jgi:hypothetical protein
MIDIDKLREEELKNLSEEDEVFDLERLIVDGADARIPVEVEFPIYKDGELTYKKYGVMIKPLKSAELSNATQIGLKDKSSDVNTEIVKLGLCKKTGELYPEDFIEKLPAGVVNKLCEKICEVSGIRQDKERNDELIREMMGF